MNRLLILIFFVCNISNSQSKVDLKFYDTCLDSIVSLEYSLQYTDISNTEFSIYIKDSIAEIESVGYTIGVLLEFDKNRLYIFHFH